MFLLLVLFVLALLKSSSAVYIDRKYTALRFGDSSKDFIEWSPDISTYKSQLSVCTWLKERSDSLYPIVLMYSSSSVTDMILGANGYYNQFVGDFFRLDNNNRPQNGDWFHVCWTWSVDKYTTSVYLDGNFIGNSTTEQREMETGKVMCLGNNAVKKYPSQAFGGDMYKLNIYNRILSISEIRSMSADMCSKEEERLDEIRVLRWDNILLKTRSGFVSDIQIEDRKLCLIQEELQRNKEKLQWIHEEINKTESQEILYQLQLQEKDIEHNLTKKKLEHTEQKLEENNLKLERVQRQLELVENHKSACQEQLLSKSSELNTTKEALDEAYNRLNATLTTLHTFEGECKETNTNLSRIIYETTTKLGVAEEKIQQLEVAAARNITVSSKWDVLFLERYFNSVLTRELYQQFKSTCDILGKRVGLGNKL